MSPALTDATPRLGLSLVLLGVAILGPACERGEPERPRGIRREASDFVCDGPRCTQRHVRLPDDGEWRCAERDGVVWCAGGEPAAGVVRVASERGYRCGTRRVPPGGVAGRASDPERICVDPAPDVPRGAREAYACRFVEERGVLRECVEKPVTPRPVTAQTLPNCWLDADCAPGTCDRGHCTKGGGS